MQLGCSIGVCVCVLTYEKWQWVSLVSVKLCPSDTMIVVDNGM